MRYAAVVWLLLIVGCGDDPVEPEPEPFAVVFSDSIRSVETTTEEVRCRFTLRAQATGGVTGDFARWTSGTGQWIDVATAQRRDFELTAADLLDYFGADRIRAGERLEATRIGSWDRPFNLLYTIRTEMPDGSLRSSDIWVYCADSA